jgi:hypothetical protein
MIERDYIGGRGGFRQQDAVGRTARDRREVGQRLLGRKRITSHPQLLPGAIAMRREILAHHRACERKAFGGHCIFEVEHQRIGAGARALDQLAFAVAGDKQHRAQNHWRPRVFIFIF